MAFLTITDASVMVFCTCTFIVEPLQFLAEMAAVVKMQVSITSQTNPRHHKEKAQNTNCHLTAITQSADMIAKLEKFSNFAIMSADCLKNSEYCIYSEPL